MLVCSCYYKCLVVRGIGFPGAEVTGGWELPSKGGGNQT